MKTTTTCEQPVDNSTHALVTALRSVYDRGFNVYAFLGRVRQEMARRKAVLFAPDYQIPEPILSVVVAGLQKNWGHIDNKFAWTRKALAGEIEKWWVAQQIRENEANKQRPLQAVNKHEVTQLKDILANMRLFNGIR